jgi:hypothetical protein
MANHHQDSDGGLVPITVEISRRAKDAAISHGGIAVGCISWLSVMSEYMIDTNGVVHVKDRAGSEYMMCGLAFDIHPKHMDEHRGPATCRECRMAVADIREALKKVRFARRLVSSSETMFIDG